MLDELLPPEPLPLLFKSLKDLLLVDLLIGSFLDEDVEFDDDDDDCEEPVVGKDVAVRTWAAERTCVVNKTEGIWAAVIVVVLFLFIKSFGCIGAGLICANFLVIDWEFCDGAGAILANCVGFGFSTASFLLLLLLPLPLLPVLFAFLLLLFVLFLFVIITGVGSISIRSVVFVSVCDDNGAIVFGFIVFVVCLLLLLLLDFELFDLLLLLTIGVVIIEWLWLLLLLLILCGVLLLLFILFSSIFFNLVFEFVNDELSNKIEDELFSKDGVVLLLLIVGIELFKVVVGDCTGCGVTNVGCGTGEGADCGGGSGGCGGGGGGGGGGDIFDSSRFRV